MAALQLNSSTLLKAGFKARTRNWGLVKETPREFSLLRGSRRRKTGASVVGRSPSPVIDTKGFFTTSVVHRKKFVFSKSNSQLNSDYDVQVEGNTSEEEEQDPAFSIANGGLRLDLDKLSENFTFYAKCLFCISSNLYASYSFFEFLVIMLLPYLHWV